MNSNFAVRTLVLASVSIALISGAAGSPGEAAPHAGKKNANKEIAPEQLAHRPAKSAKQQMEILQKRRSVPQMIGKGSFDAFTSYLYAFNDMCLHTHDAQVNSTPLNSVYPDSYKSTNAELFETLARQTKSTCKYDPTTDYWTFDPPAMPLPYKIDLAGGWKADNRGFYVSYAPKIAPIGMDIYMVGRYSGLNEAQLKKTRDELAVKYGRLANPQLSGTAGMKQVTVDGVDALYMETPVPRPKTTLRQWVFIKNGQGYVIVSVIQNTNEAVLLPAVQKMIESFKLVKPAPASPGV